MQGSLGSNVNSSAVELQDGLMRLIAPNPSPMTSTGTNTYILGRKELLIIDPGPNSEAHLRNIMEVIPKYTKVTHILITHSHLDHSGLAPKLSKILNAPTLAFGTALDGLSNDMKRICKMGLTFETFGIDTEFVPDHFLEDKEKISSLEWEVVAHHTPGHLSNHICYQYLDKLFTGDHIMEWSTSVISPPEGDVSQFINSCEKIYNLHCKKFYPGHGIPVENPSERIVELIEHRKKREAEILNFLKNRDATISQITKKIYLNIDQNLLSVASRNVKAHLVDLIIKKQVTVDDISSDTAMYSLL
jgi:glyoxylase-like metal-dependent hydrolase (beta-lactamase superfamily II)